MVQAGRRRRNSLSIISSGTNPSMERTSQQRRSSLSAPTSPLPSRKSEVLVAISSSFFNKAYRRPSIEENNNKLFLRNCQEIGSVVCDNNNNNHDYTVTDLVKIQNRDKFGKMMRRRASAGACLPSSSLLINDQQPKKNLNAADQALQAKKQAAIQKFMLDLDDDDGDNETRTMTRTRNNEAREMRRRSSIGVCCRAEPIASSPPLLMNDKQPKKNLSADNLALQARKQAAVQKFLLDLGDDDDDNQTRTPIRERNNNKAREIRRRSSIGICCPAETRVSSSKDDNELDTMHLSARNTKRRSSLKGNTRISSPTEHSNKSSTTQQVRRSSGDKLIAAIDLRPKSDSAYPVAKGKRRSSIGHCYERSDTTRTTTKTSCSSFSSTITRSRMMQRKSKDDECSLFVKVKDNDNDKPALLDGYDTTQIIAPAVRRRSSIGSYCAEYNASVANDLLVSEHTDVNDTFVEGLAYFAGRKEHSVRNFYINNNNKNTNMPSSTLEAVH